MKEEEEEAATMLEVMVGESRQWQPLTKLFILNQKLLTTSF